MSEEFPHDREASFAQHVGSMLREYFTCKTLIYTERRCRQSEGCDICLFPISHIVTCMCISRYIEETCEWQAYVSIKGASCPSCGRFCAVWEAEESQAMSNRLHSYVFSGNRARAPRATPARHPVRDKK